MNRILWNKRPKAAVGGGGDVDEIVVQNPRSIHIEQQDDRCWWMAITLTDGTCWEGNFHADSRGRMTFSEQESDVIWDKDDTHE